MDKVSEKLCGIGKYKVPLLVAVLGIVLMLLPSFSSPQKTESIDGDELLERVLSCTYGVGEARVLISDNGVVIVCRGADSASVRLDIIRAVSSYTGYGSDKITILKMAD